MPRQRSGIRMTAAVELEKLMLAIPTGPISLRAVDALVADRGVGSLFAFADAIVARSGTLVSKHLLRAVTEPGPMVVATLHRKMRDLAQIHGATVVDGNSVATAARAIGMHEYPAGKMAEAARRWSSAEIVDALRQLRLVGGDRGGDERHTRTQGLPDRIGAGVAHGDRGPLEQGALRSERHDDRVRRHRTDDAVNVWAMGDAHRLLKHLEAIVVAIPVKGVAAIVAG